MEPAFRTNQLASSANQPAMKRGAHCTTPTAEAGFAPIALAANEIPASPGSEAKRQRQLDVGACGICGRAASAGIAFGVKHFCSAACRSAVAGAGRAAAGGGKREGEVMMAAGATVRLVADASTGGYGDGELDVDQTAWASGGGAVYRSGGGEQSKGFF